MENRVQMKRPVIEFFPVYKSYPKHFAGNVGLSPTLNFLGMMIFCEKNILINILNKFKGSRVSKISLIYKFHVLCLRIKVMINCKLWLKKTLMLYDVVFEIPR